jgi:hypothetical protein
MQTCCSVSELQKVTCCNVLRSEEATCCSLAYGERPAFSAVKILAEFAQVAANDAVLSFDSRFVAASAAMT